MNIKPKTLVIAAAGVICVGLGLYASGKEKEMTTLDVIESSALRIQKVYRDPSKTDDDLNKAIDEYVELKKLYQPVPTD